VENLLKGILVASLSPFDSEYRLDVKATHDHMAWLSKHRFGGLVCNAHAGEGETLTRQERKTIIRIAREEIKGKFPIVAGVEAVAIPEVAELIKDAKEAGADAVMVCPPPIHGWVANLNPEIAVTYHQEIYKSIDFPQVLFRYRRDIPFSYPTSALVDIVKTVPSVIGIKLAGSDVMRYEDDVRALLSLDKKITIMPAATLMSYYFFQFYADGGLTGFANFAPKMVIDLFDECKKDNVALARKIHNQIYGLARIIYGDTSVNIHTRYKVAAAYIGSISSSRVRLPLKSVAESEQKKIHAAMVEAGLL
jgi:4-hydroxy-tetrahydrodipicolinate synthase